MQRLLPSGDLPVTQIPVLGSDFHACFMFWWMEPISSLYCFSVALAYKGGELGLTSPYGIYRTAT